MSRIYNPTAMYKYAPMQKAGGAGKLDSLTLVTPWNNFKATSFTSQATGDIAWTDPNNAQLEDALYATSNMGIFQTSEYLRGLALDTTGLDITDTIVGLEVSVVGKITGVNPVQLDELQLYFFGTQGDNKGGGIFTNQTDTEFIFGGPSDIWGYGGITPTITKSGNFGLQMKVSVAAAEEVDINSIKMRFYYESA